MVISQKETTTLFYYFTQQYSRTFKLARFPQIFFYFFILLKIGKKRKGDKSLKIRLASLIFSTSLFLFSRCRRYTSQCLHP